MPWAITTQSESDAEILLYDVIGGYDENWDYQGAKALINKIKGLGDVKNIRLRINSVGGDVFEAQAMYRRSELLRCFEIFFLVCRTLQLSTFFSTRQDLNPTSGISGYGCNGMHR